MWITGGSESGENSNAELEGGRMLSVALPYLPHKASVDHTNYGVHPSGPDPVRCITSVMLRTGVRDGRVGSRCFSLLRVGGYDAGMA